MAAGGCWWLLVAAGGGWWWLLVAAGGCWWLLVAAGGCWWLLVAAGGCWWLLVAAGGYWWLLVAGSEGTHRKWWWWMMMMMMLATFSSAGEETPTAAATAAGSWLLCPKLFFPYALPLASAGVGGYIYIYNILVNLRIYMYIFIILDCKCLYESCGFRTWERNMTFSRPPVRAVDKAEELNHKAQITWQRHTKTQKTNRNKYKILKEVWTKVLKDRNTFEHPFETKWTDVEDDCRSLNKWKGRVFRGLELPTCSAKVPSERKLSCACEVLSSM